MVGFGRGSNWNDLTMNHPIPSWADPTAFTRRRVLSGLGTGGAIALAGCLGAADDETGAETDPTTEQPTPSPEPEPDTGTPGAEDEDDPNLEPAPTGAELSGDEIAALVDAFDDRVYQGAQSDPFTPEHVNKWVTDDSFIFLHFDEEDPSEANKLLWIGVGVKGVFSEDGQPGPEFTHFHQPTSDSWDGGHGGDAGDEGFWLTHIAVDEFESPFGMTSPGVHYEFMPTPPSDHDGATTADFDTDEQGPLDPDEIARLVDLFDDQPFEGGQETPKHVWKWVNEDVLMFLHVDEEDVTQATALDYFGIGVRGEFSAESQPHEEDFTHFHKWNSEEWDAGHGGQPGQHGYWLVHHATRPHEEPWGDVEIGIDREFMPTPVG